MTNDSKDSGIHTPDGRRRVGLVQRLAAAAAIAGAVGLGSVGVASATTVNPTVTSSVSTSTIAAATASVPATSVLGPAPVLRRGTGPSDAVTGGAA